MRVAVCDDNGIFLEEMKRILFEYAIVRDVRTYISPLEILMQIKENIEFDVVFMDIDLGNDSTKDGFYWSEELKESMPDVPVIFVTSYNDEYAQKVMLANANVIGYMTKPIDKEILEKYFVKIQKKKKEEKYLAISKQGQRIAIPMNEIIHIESHNHKAIICTEKEEYVVYEKLSELLVRLTEDFITCHKSFIVNLSWITFVEGKRIGLRNGKEIPVSRANGMKVKEAFFRYLGERI